MNRLDIEWQHIEESGNTCIRCADTGEALQDVIAKLAEECKPCGWDIRFKETRLAMDQIKQSNGILFNGRPIEAILPEAKVAENHCQSCCEFTGNAETFCRTLEVDGIVHEAIPAALIRQATCEVAQCC